MVENKMIIRRIQSLEQREISSGTSDKKTNLSKIIEKQDQKTIISIRCGMLLILIIKAKIKLTSTPKIHASASL